LLVIKKIFSWISGIGLAILPKCPICYVTYSSSIAICGLESSPDLMGINTPIVLGLGSITIIFLLFNYRGLKTITSIGLVTGGITVFLLMDPNILSSTYLYYTGSGAILIGVLINKKSMIPKFKSRDQENIQVNSRTSFTDCQQCEPSFAILSKNYK